MKTEGEKPTVTTDKKKDTQMDKSTQLHSHTSPTKKDSLSSPSDPKAAVTFSQLLQGVVLSANNAHLKAEFGMSHREALASVTSTAGQAHVQMQDRTNSQSSANQPPIPQSGSLLPCSSAVKQESSSPLQCDVSQEKNGANIVADMAPPQRDLIQKEKNGAHVVADTIPPLLPCSSTVKQEPSLPLQRDFSQEEKSGANVVANIIPPHRDFSQEEKNGAHVAVSIPWTPKPDGYSWRKYGQKQVKASGSSRSYYRCTYLDCYAKKKVQHLDTSGQIIDIEYMGNHNHDPPRTLKAYGRKKAALSSEPVTLVVHEPSNPTVQKVDDRQALTPESACSTSQSCNGEQPASVPCSTPKKEREEAKMPAEPERCVPSSSHEVTMIDPMKDLNVAPLKKRRIKEGSKPCSEPIYKTFNEPKIIVHTAGNAETSIDGYKWRKYGQKMVKGSPHPRSYYRCSSTGCPVRKHVERASDNSMSIVITYEGQHDHDMPAPKTYQTYHVYPGFPPGLVNASEGSDPVPNSLSPNPESKVLSPPQAEQSRDSVNNATGAKASEVESDKLRDCHNNNSEEKAPGVGSDKVSVRHFDAEEKAPGVGKDKVSAKDILSDVNGEKTSEITSNKVRDGSADDNGKKASEVASDKVAESARPLLSVGIELKSC